MKITESNIETIREQMGADASMAEARRMFVLLTERGYSDSDELTDAEWFAMVAECVEKEAK